MAHTETVPPLLLTKRWMLAYICFYGYFCQYLHRVNLSLAIVCMVKTPLPSNSTLPEVSSVLRNESRDVGISAYEKQISNTTASYTVLDHIPEDASACGLPLEKIQTENEIDFYGVIVTQVLGGWLAIRFGGKKSIAFAMVIQAVCSILVPELTRVDFKFLIILRVITGLVAGTVSPTFFTIWTRWAPPDERGRLLNISLLGGVVGVIVSFSTTGFMCAYGFDSGWGSIFYIHGFLTLVYVAVWLLFVSETPSDHPSITECEKSYITRTTTGSVADHQRDTSIPWKNILTSPAVLVLAFTHTCCNWSNYVILTTLPLYMKEVLQFDIKQNGLLSSLPHICTALSMTLAGLMSDVVIKRGCLTITATRRVFQGTRLCEIPDFYNKIHLT